MKKLSEIIFFLGLFLVLLLPPFDPDLGWHLRCGELMIKEGGFCRENHFSTLLNGYQWTNHHWLYQILLFLIWKKFDLWGLTIFNALIVTLALSLFNLTIKNWKLEKKWAILLALVFSWNVFNLGIRSQILGILYFLALLFLLSGQRKSSRFLLLLTFLLWANTHGSVVFGLIFLFLFSLKNFWKNFFFLVLSILSSIINPFGWKIFFEAWRHLTIPLEKLIAEWVPPEPFKRTIVFLGGISLLFLTEKFSWPTILSLSFLALKARRNLPFFFFFFFFLLFKSHFFQKWLSSWKRKKSLRSDLLTFTSLTLFFYGLFIRLPQTLRINSSFQNYCQTSPLTYPYEAITFLKQQPEKGNLFNRYEWGGFLIWQLKEYKVFIDGRMPAWPTPSGKSPYTIYLETLQTKPGWQETLTNYDINWILISPETFMDLKLKPNPEKFGWKEVWRDKKSVIYKKV